MSSSSQWQKDDVYVLKSWSSWAVKFLLYFSAVNTLVSEKPCRGDRILLWKLAWSSMVTINLETNNQVQVDFNTWMYFPLIKNILIIIINGTNKLFPNSRKWCMTFTPVNPSVPHFHLDLLLTHLPHTLLLHCEPHPNHAQAPWSVRIKWKGF